MRESWRADALAQSRHTRWADELRAPLADHDPEKAEAICAAVTRAALRDFAPALLLLGPAERLRARALAAYVLTLFDFAGQPGLEGERLTQINRMEFDLEAALAGEPRGEPLFVLMARTRPWSEEALDGIVACARRRVAQPRPESPRAAGTEALELGGALAAALVEDRAAAAGILAAGLLRLTDLLGLWVYVRRQRPRLSREALPDDWIRGAHRSPDLERAIRDECRAVAELFDEVGLDGLSTTERRAARYLLAAGRRLVRESDRRGAGLLDGPPKLGALTRMRLLVGSLL